MKTEPDYPSGRGRGSAGSVAARLAWSYVLATVALLIVAEIFVYWGLLGSLRRQDERLLASKTRVLRTLLQNPAQAQALESEIEHEAGEDQALKFYIRILDAEFRPLHATPEMGPLLPTAVFPVVVSGEMIEAYRDPADRVFLLLTADAWTSVDRRDRRIIQIALDTSMNLEILEEYRARLLLVFAGGAMVASLAGVIITRRGLRPLRQITDAVQEVTVRCMHLRLDAARWPRELQELAGAFDQMLDRLQPSFDRLNQFSADLAHALRNPLNNLRGEAEVALTCNYTPEEYRHTLGSALEEYERLSKLIDSLLFLARADNPQASLDREVVSAAFEFEAVRDFYDALAEKQEVEVTCTGDGGIWGAPILVRRAISNLLGNALKHTPPGGAVSLSARPLARGAVEVQVVDTGCGIAAEHLSRVFDRFFQVDRTRSAPANGAGLGLAIVRSIMQLHGGSATMRSVLKQGTTVTLTFPGPGEGNAPSVVRSQNLLVTSFSG